MNFRKEASLAAGLIGALVVGAAAHETDQFSSPPGRQFADLHDQFTPWVYATLERAVRRANTHVSLGEDRAISADELARLVFREFPLAYTAIEGLEVKLHSRALRQAYPGQVVGSKTAFGQIYQGAHFPLDPRRLFKFWFASTFKAYGVHSGTDKVGHFIDMGHTYYQEYHKALRRGADEMEARAAAVRLGTEHPIFSEAGVLGYVSAGAYSNADLASNYAGMLFYINLTQPVRLKGVMRPAMLEREQRGYWKLADHVRPNSDFFSWFFSDHFDEALNPSLFDISLRGGMRRAIATRADNLLWRYRDENECRRPMQYFEDLAVELRTYWGEDYGHRGDVDEVITLADACFTPVDEQSEPDQHNRTGHNALHWAVESGDVAVVQRLLDGGFPADAPMKPAAQFAGSERGNTALHLAARLDRATLVDLLLRADADPWAVNSWGATPLHLARGPYVAQRLLEEGADVAALDTAGRSALHWAAAVPGNAAVASLLQAGADPNDADHQRRTPLHLAVRTGSDRSVELLLAAGGSTAAADRLGITPLHEAAQRGAVAMVGYLLAAGAAVDVVDAMGYRPLHLAAREGRPSITAALLEHRAQVNASDAFGTTPLHLAARHGSLAVAELLLQNDAEVRTASASGMTPLHEAAAVGDGAMAMRLLEAGAIADAADALGRSVRQIAEASGYQAVLDALEGRSSTILGVPRTPLDNGRAPAVRPGREYLR